MNSEQHIEQEISKLKLFIKTGLLILPIILFLGIGILWYQNMESKKSIAANTSATKKRPIYCVDTKEAKIALSFDAAWGNEDTKEILSILKKQKIKVTFFMTGGWIKKYPEDVKAIAKAGHELGNHSENHKQMSQISFQKCKEEIMKPHETIKALTGKEMTVFRPPYGDYNNTLLAALEECGYYGIQWDVDSLDWKDYGVDSIIDTVVNHKHLGNGSIILCHNGAKYTAKALDKMITALKEKGYTFVTMSELIYKDHYEINLEGRQIRK